MEYVENKEETSNSMGVNHCWEISCTFARCFVGNLTEILLFEQNSRALFKRVINPKRIYFQQIHFVETGTYLEHGRLYYKYINIVDTGL